MNDLDDWIEAYRDGALSDDDREALEQALKQDPKARERFVAQMNLSAMLEQRLVKAFPSAETATPQQRRVPFAGRVQKPKEGSRVFLVGAIAACLALAIFLLTRPEGSISGSDVVAVITSAENAEWSDGTQPAVGSSLGIGMWELSSGRVEVQLENGAELYLDGPLKIEVESALRTTLHAGELSARIPPAALGFRVFTPEVEVIDLGTEFSVSVAEGGDSAVRVLDGFVDARLLDGSNLSQRLAAQQEAKFGAGREDFAPRFNSLRPIDPRAPNVGGDIRLLHEPPASLQAQAFEHEYLLIFREQSELLLAEDIGVDLAEPGISRPTKGAIQHGGPRLPAGQRIDCWMVHFDGLAADQLVCEAEIAFPSDVLGVIAVTRSLNESDRVLGVEGKTYPKRQLRGMEFHADDPYQIDEIVLSGDRRLLKLRWHVSTAVDQIRVITAAPQS